MPPTSTSGCSRLAGTPGNKLIVVEGIYSMLGDQAPLAEMSSRSSASTEPICVVDEAHSMGVLGDNGRGLAEAQGVEDDVDFVVGTFSKSLGAIGGFCVSDHPEFDLLRGALPALHVHGLAAALDRGLGDGGARRGRAPAGAAHASCGPTSTRSMTASSATACSLGPQKGPVVAVHLPTPELAVQAWQALLQSGVYVNLALPPATPNGASLLRCSVCAAHSRHQLERVIDTITEVAYQIGVLSEPARAAG